MKILGKKKLAKAKPYGELESETACGAPPLHCVEAIADEKKEEDECLFDEDDPEFDICKKLFNSADVKKKMCQHCQQEIPSSSLRCFHCHSDQAINPLDVDVPITVIKNGKLFKLYRTSIVDDDGDLPPFYSYIFKLKDKNIIRNLSSYVKLVHTTKRGRFTNRSRATAQLREFIVALPKIRAIVESLDHTTRDFINHEIEPLVKEVVGQVKACVKRKKIPMDGLWFLFESGTAVCGVDKYNNPMGAIVKSTAYSAIYSGTSFTITGSIIKTDGESFYHVDHGFTIAPFNGMKKLNDLSVTILNNTAFKALDARGKLFSELGVGNHYQQYRGTFYRKVGTHVTRTKTSGRVMMDTKMHNEKFLSDQTYRDPRGAAAHAKKELTESETWMTYPFLPAFNFSLKQWGEVCVQHVTPIQFDTQAFARLVLPDRKKSLIHALVEDYRRNASIVNDIEEELFNKEEKNEPINEDAVYVDEHGNSQVFTDIITGKGGGCIFLLHGSPGVGKTLTAEAVCEHLSIPLYMITVGELGTTPMQLEKNLQEILELAAAWGCGILLDEADIFLEKRSKKDIVRNAMVGVFLRLLEYHNGVLFLTTNRLSCIDEAFGSRISVALHYHELDIAARSQIWHTFLTSTITNEQTLQAIDIPTLASYQMNGRQIRSCVRLSVAKSRIDGVPLSMEHLIDTIMLSVDFKNYFLDEKVVKKVVKKEDRRQTIAIELPDPFVASPVTPL